MKKTYSTKNTKAYVAFIVQILKDFGIICTEEQRKTLRHLPTEEAVDRYKQQLIKERMKHA